MTSPQAVEPRRKPSRRRDSGVSIVEVVMAIGIAVFLGAGAWALFSMLTQGVDGATARLRATQLTTEVVSRLKLRAMRGRQVITDPPAAPAVDPDPPNPPPEPITKLLVELNTGGADIVYNTYETRCRSIAANPWFRGIDEAVLSNMVRKMKELCGGVVGGAVGRYPCSDTSLPWLHASERPSGMIRETPPPNANPKSYGVVALGLCVGWRPDNAGSFDIKAVGGYLAGANGGAQVVGSSISVINNRMGTTEIRVVGP